MNACILIPNRDHGDALVEVVAALADVGRRCLIVDDASGGATRKILREIVRRHAFVEVIHHSENRGKGGALKTGYRAALRSGFTHAVQLDADGQHSARDVPRFLAAARRHPEALVLGVPVFDETVPRSRLYARQISRALVWAACLSRAIPDPLCGFRALPLGPTVRLIDRVSTGDWMDFDPELAVRLVWEGLTIEPVPTRVVYARDSLSHFSVARDYPRLASLYARLLLGMLRRAPALRRQRGVAEART